MVDKSPEDATTEGKRLSLFCEIRWSRDSSTVLRHGTDCFRTAKGSSLTGEKQGECIQIPCQGQFLGLIPECQALYAVMQVGLSYKPTRNPVSNEAVFNSSAFLHWMQMKPWSLSRDKSS